MNYSLLISLLVLLFVGCKEKTVEYSNRKYIQAFYYPDPSRNYFTGDSTEYLPAPDSFKILFILVDSNRIAYVRKGSLSEVYREHFNVINYYNFMYDALNQKTIFPSRIISDYKFHLIKSITNAYQQKGVEGLLKTYFEKVESAYQLKLPLETDQELTILYFMFLNKYEIDHNDYEGSYYVRNIS